MAIVRYKVLVVEVDGTELEYHEERALDASNIFFDNLDYDNVQDGLANVGDLVATLVVPISLVYNGSVGNNEFIGYSNLLSGDATPIVSPLQGSFTGFTFSNNRNTADLSLEFRRGSTTATPFFTWTETDAEPQTVTLPTPEPFSLGEEIYIKHINNGTGARDMVVVLLFKA